MPASRANRTLESSSSAVASISAVSEALELKGKGTVQNAMNWLIDRGYVRIEGRGRNTKFKITPEGSSMLEKMETDYA